VENLAPKEVPTSAYARVEQLVEESTCDVPNYEYKVGVPGNEGIIEVD
jgi:hypothetical protein